jgi:hypothetical protein
MNVMLRLAGLVLVLVLVGAAPAAAKPWSVAPSDTVTAGPLLAGDEIVWVQPDATGVGLYRASATAPARRATHLYSDPTEDELFEEEQGGVASSHFLGGLAAAQGTVAVWLTESFNSLFSHALHAGPLGPLGPSVTSDSGDSSNGPQCDSFSTGDVAVAPDAVVFVHNSRCQAPARGQILLQALPKTGAPIQLDPDARAVSGVRIADRWVAWRRTLDAGTEIAVYDRTAGTISYKVADAAAGYDVDEDGRLAIVREDGTVAWYSPSEPAAHDVALDGVTRVAAGGGRIAYEEPSAGGSRIGTIEMAPGATKVDEVLIPSTRAASWDFDGQRLAWAQRGCVYPLLRVETDLTTPGAPAPDVECRVHVRSTVLRPTRSGALRVSVDCPAGCSGRLSLAAPKLFRGRRSVAIEQAGRDTLTIRLKAKERRKLVRLKRVRGTLVARVGQGSGGTRDYSTRVTLRR